MRPPQRVLAPFAALVFGLLAPGLSPGLRAQGCARTFGPMGPELRTSQTVFYDQIWSMVARGTNRFTCAWSEGQDVYARQFDLALNPLGSQFLNASAGKTPLARISMLPMVRTTKPQKTSAWSGPATGSRRIFRCAMPIERRFHVRRPISFPRGSSLPILRKRYIRCALNEKHASATIRTKRKRTLDGVIASSYDRASSSHRGRG